MKRSRAYYRDGQFTTIANPFTPDEDTLLTQIARDGLSVEMWQAIIPRPLGELLERRIELGVTPPPLL